MAKFPSIKARKMLSILEREPLKYRVFRRAGSHRKLVSSNGYPIIGFSFHDAETLSPGEVREILVKKIGLSEKDALDLL
ncbi:MAG: hypothetical protein RDV48_19970 [Candidatus Eremiobacteraeota bacterium]|nr:hypothetical protein [Candidatus Eremiobacteraeota bacterium]